MAPIIDNNRIHSPLPESYTGPRLLPIAPSPSDSRDSILDSISTQGRKLGSEFHHGIATGSARLFGSVQQFVGEGIQEARALIDTVEETAVSLGESLLGVGVYHQLQTSLSNFFGLKEETSAGNQMTPLGGVQSITLSPKTNSVSLKSSGALEEVATISNSRLDAFRLLSADHSSIVAAIPILALMRSLAQVLEPREQRAVQSISSIEQDFNSPSHDAASLVSNFITTPFTQATATLLGPPLHLALSLERYLQAQYDPFPTRTAVLDSRNRLNTIAAPGLLSSIPEENDLLNSLVKRTNTSLVAFREAIRGERFFVYKHRENPQTQTRPDSVDSPRSIGSFDLATLSQAQDHPQITLVKDNSEGLRIANGSITETAIPLSNSIVTHAIAMSLAAQNSRLSNPHSSISYNGMVNSFERHDRVEASAASLHSGNGEHRGSSQSDSQDSSQQQSHETEFALEDLPLQSSPAHLPAGDLQASVFCIA